MTQARGVQGPEVEAFVRNLEAFHDSLPADQQVLLHTVLDAAREVADTAGYVMQPNLYGTEMAARGRRDDALREAEMRRMVKAAQESSSNATTVSGSPGSRFSWLHNWLPIAKATR